MARTRLIKPGFFANDQLGECDPLARLLFAGLWTLADRDGRMECRPVRIKAQILPYDTCDVEALLGQLAERGFVTVYEVDGRPLVQVNEFVRHQNPHPKELSSGLPEPPKNPGETQSHGKAVTSHGNSTASHGNSGTSPAFSLLPSPFSLSVATTVPATRRKRSQPPGGIVWTPAAGWEGIEDADRQEWAKAFPACDLAGELARATAWLRANPSKAHKSNWRRFLVSWLTRSQDRGGTHREPGRPGGLPPPSDPAKRKHYRADAGCSMTEAEYAAWHKDRAKTQGAKT